jgi:hypothetical protein
MQWTMANAKRDFAAGYLSGFELASLRPLVSVWIVRLQGPAGAGALVDARSKEAREFKTLDAAVRAIEEIGFQVNALRQVQP